MQTAYQCTKVEAVSSDFLTKSMNALGFISLTHHVSHKTFKFPCGLGMGDNKTEQLNESSFGFT